MKIKMEPEESLRWRKKNLVLLLLYSTMHTNHLPVGSALARAIRKKPRMIITKHPIVRATKRKPAKSKKSPGFDSDDGGEVEFG